MGVIGDTIETQSQYILSHKSTLSIIWVRPKEDKRWTDMFRAAETEKRPGQRGWEEEERKEHMDDRMNEIVGEGQVCDWKEDRQTGLTVISINQLSGHNLMMCHNAKSEPAWNQRVKKKKRRSIFFSPPSNSHTDYVSLISEYLTALCWT